jgi:hypothetical protein
VLWKQFQHFWHCITQDSLPPLPGSLGLFLSFLGSRGSLQPQNYLSGPRFELAKISLNQSSKLIITDLNCSLLPVSPSCILQHACRPSSLYELIHDQGFWRNFTLLFSPKVPFRLTSPVGLRFSSSISPSYASSVH